MAQATLVQHPKLFNTFAKYYTTSQTISTLSKPPIIAHKRFSHDIKKKMDTHTAQSRYNPFDSNDRILAELILDKSLYINLGKPEIMIQHSGKLI